jgi:Zn-dependent protease
MSGVDIGDFLSNLFVYMVVWLFAVSAHEAAHAWTSYKFGDDTAYLLGRVTLNPVPHIDIVGTFILPIIGFLLAYSPTMVGIPLIMWGKPTPVNPLKWRNKDTANVCVSLAGIVANLIIATIAATIIKLLIAFQFFTQDNIATGITRPVWLLLTSTVFMNVGLAVFNLLPFPPLDGSKVLQTFLPESFQPVFEILEQFGFIILLILMQMGIISFLVSPIQSVILYLLF